MNIITMASVVGEALKIKKTVMYGRLYYKLST